MFRKKSDTGKPDTAPKIVRLKEAEPTPTSVAVVVCVSAKVHENVSTFVKQLVQHVRSLDVTIHVVTVRASDSIAAAGMSNSDENLISRASLFCPVMDSEWFRDTSCTEYYVAGTTYAQLGSLILTPIVVLSETLLLDSRSVRVASQTHVCLFIRIDAGGCQQADVASTASRLRALLPRLRTVPSLVLCPPQPQLQQPHHQQQHQQQHQQLQQQQHQLEPKSSIASASLLSLSMTSSSVTLIVPVEQKKQLLALQNRVLHLTMTEDDLTLFGKSGSPGVQPSPIEFTGLTDLLTFYETHRFHLGKTVQVIHTIAQRLEGCGPELEAFRRTGWLGVLSHTHSHSTSEPLKTALARLIAVCHNPAQGDHVSVTLVTKMFLQAVDALGESLPSNGSGVNDVLCGAALTAIRHLTWKNVELKTLAGQTQCMSHIALLLRTQTPAIIEAKGYHVTVSACLALAHLAVDPHNKAQILSLGVVGQLSSIIQDCSDDMAIAAACAALLSLAQGATVKQANQTAGDQTEAPSDGEATELEPALDALFRSFSNVIPFSWRLVTLTPKPSICGYACELLRLFLQSNTTKRTMVTDGTLVANLLVLLKSCCVTKPLPFGAAVISRKVCVCLGELLSGMIKTSHAVIRAGGCRPLVDLVRVHGKHTELYTLLQEAACRCLIAVCAVASGPQAIYLERGVENVLGGLSDELQFCHNESLKKGTQNGGQGVTFCLSERSRGVAEHLLLVLCSLSVNEIARKQFAQHRVVPILLALLDYRYPASFLKLVLASLDAVCVVDDKGEAVGWSAEEIEALGRFVQQQSLMASRLTELENVPLSRMRVPTLDFSSLHSTNKPVTLKNVVDVCRGLDDERKSKVAAGASVVADVVGVADHAANVLAQPLLQLQPTPAPLPPTALKSGMSASVANQLVASDSRPRLHSHVSVVTSDQVGDLEHAVNNMYNIASKLISMVEGASELHKEDIAHSTATATDNKADKTEKSKALKWLPKIPKPSKVKEDAPDELATSIAESLHTKMGWQQQLDKCDEELDRLQEELLSVEVTVITMQSRTAAHLDGLSGRMGHKHAQSELAVWLRDDTSSAGDADDTRSIAESEFEASSASVDQANAQLTNLRQMISAKQTERKEIFAKLERAQGEHKKFETVANTRDAIANPDQLLEMSRALSQLRDELLHGLRHMGPHSFSQARTRSTSAPRLVPVDDAVRKSKLEQAISVCVQLRQNECRRVMYSWQALCLRRRLQENHSLLARLNIS